MISKKTNVLVLITIFLSSLFVAEAKVKSDSIIVNKIWDKEAHNAFPDLFKFKGNLYCAFREGANHVDNNNTGKVRVMRSKNGSNWETVALFSMKGADVREARLSVTPDGKLMAILAAGVWKDGSYLSLSPYVAYSDKKGNSFGALEKITVEDSGGPAIDWIWRVTWHKGIGYGVMYRIRGDRKAAEWEAHLLSTKDGKNYTIIKQLAIDGNPNESTIRFDENDEMFIVVRREAGDQNGVLARSAFPYTNWSFNAIDFKLGGPNFLFLNKKQIILGSRFRENKTSSTRLFVMDLNAKVLKTIILPSGGDTSYPGMVLEKNKLWVAYYSSHEGKSSIYLAQVPLSKLETN